MIGVGLWSRRSLPMPGAGDLIPSRIVAGYNKIGTQKVDNDTALRHSAVWACLRLRANLISTMPVDVYRRVSGMQVEVTKPPIFTNPGGDNCDLLEWLYSSQFDLDRMGNSFGLITQRWHNGQFPSRVELLPAASVKVVIQKNQIVGYRIEGHLEDPANVWHEKQYTVAGLHVGLSPIAYAAWSIGEYLSIQQFATDWFGKGAVPKAHLRNNAKTLTPDESNTVKDRFTAALQSGEVFVSGQDWEYNMIQSQQTGQEWLDDKKYGVTDVARFFDVPADLIDGGAQGSNVTYANIGQRNLQFLIMNLGPTVVRRENALSKWLPQLQYVKFNTDALMRMDPMTRAQVLKTKIDSMQLTPTEARELDNLPALSPQQRAEFPPPQRTYDPFDRYIPITAAAYGAQITTIPPALPVTAPGTESVEISGGTGVSTTQGGAVTPIAIGGTSEPEASEPGIDTDSNQDGS